MNAAIHLAASHDPEAGQYDKKSPRPRHPVAFRRQVVRLVLVDGRDRAQLAAEIGVSIKTLNRWIRELRRLPE